jgi:hypothetical protein
MEMRRHHSTDSTQRRTDVTRLLMPAHRRDLSADELLAAASRPLERALRAACAWIRPGRTWEIGDYSFLVLSTRPAPDVSLFMQWWSEPLEPVVAEVCSGGRNAPERRYMGSRGRQMLKAFGYHVSKESPNYRKLVEVENDRDLAAMAREALVVLHDVFGYRGRTGLEVHAVRDGRSRRDSVHDAVTPEDVARVVMSGGDLAEVKISASGQPVVFASGAVPWLVHLPWRAGPGNLFAGLHFYRLIPRPAVVDTDVVNRLNDGLLFGKVVVDEDGDLALTQDVRIDGGVTTAWLASVVAQWREVVAEVDTRLRVAKESLVTMAAAAQIASAKGLLQE